MGVRSMCTFIQTPDVKLLVDPGVSLGPRFHLLPHPKEYECLLESRKRITQYADKADIVTISHYHYDHCTPTYIDRTWTFSDSETAHRIYGKKIILAKNIRNNINPRQRRRGWILKKNR
ncbi:MAG: MBL fold metallo-hydrolase [Candidatus Bathyarchaeota archaeon]